jgi:hypothetical protein
MKRKLAILSIVVLGLLSIPVIQAGAAITPGTKCAKAGLQSVYKSKIYTCIKLGSKLFWDNGITYYLTNPSPSPAPTVTVTATPAPAPTVTITASPAPAPTVTVTAKPSPAPTVTITASPKVPPASLPAVTSFYASIGGSFLSFSFNKPVTTSKITNYELAAQYLLNPNSAMNSYSSYSELKVIRSIYSTSFDVWLSEIQDFLTGNDITSKDRSVMFRLRAINNDVSTSPWSTGLYFTPNQIWERSAPKPSPSPSPTKTVAPTPTPAPQTDTFGLNILGTWSGSDPLNSSSGYPWVVTKVSNKASTGVLRSGLVSATFVDSQGVSVHTNTDGTPTLLPNQFGWMASTIFNTKNAASTFLSYLTTPKVSEIKASELPTLSNIAFTAKPGGGIVTATIKNNSPNLFISKSTGTNVVFLNSQGIPIYSYWGSIKASIAPGFSARIELPAHLGEDLPFVPAGYASIEISLEVSLCESDSSYSTCKS